MYDAFDKVQKASLNFPYVIKPRLTEKYFQSKNNGINDQELVQSDRNITKLELSEDLTIAPL